MKAIPFFLIDIHLTFMPRFRLSLSLIFSFLILSLAARAQEDARQLEGWTVSSSRIGDKEFRIRFELADSKNLTILTNVDKTVLPILCIAGYAGEVRLIDNMFLD